MPTATAPRRLVRRTDDRIVAGVASGVASYLGLDPVLVRVLFVLAVFAGGIGFVAYGAVWFLAPEAAGPMEPATDRSNRSAGFWVAIALFVLGGLALADNVADRSLVWPVLLIGAGVALWRSDASRASAGATQVTWPTSDDPAGAAGAADPSAGDVDPAAGGGAATTDGGVPTLPSHAARARQQWDEDVAASTGGEGIAGRFASDTAAIRERVTADAHQQAADAVVAASESAARRWQRRRSERDRSPLGGIAFGSMLLVVGTLLLLDRLDAIDVTGATVAASALLVLGVGLLVGSVYGRARWLAWPAVLVVLPVLMAATFADGLEVDLTAGFGERTITLAPNEDLADEYAWGVGEFVLDLGDLEGGGLDDPLVTHATLAVGQLTVVVPEDMTVVLDYDLALGGTNLLGDTEEGGPDLSGTRTFEGTAGGGRLELEADLGVGELVLVRDDPDA